MREKSAHAGERSIPVQNKVLLRRLQVSPRHIQRKNSFLRRAAQFAEHRSIFWPYPRIDCAVIQRACFVWDDLVQIEVDGVAETFAARARAIRIVERKK